LAALTTAASLMGCSEQELMLALSTHKIQAGKDSIAKRLTLQQVVNVNIPSCPKSNAARKM